MFICRIFLILLIAFSFMPDICMADELRLDKDTCYQKILNETGFRLLNANNIPNRATFYYLSENKVKTKINVRLKRLYLYKGVFPYLEDENEYAALISIELARLLDIQTGFFRRFSISYSPRKYEIRADKRAVDLMVNAGYDPVAIITLLNKLLKEQCWYEYNIFKHNGSERMKQVYFYIYEKYPVYLADNKYIKNPYYQNFLRVTKNDRKRMRLIQENRLNTGKI